MYYSKNKNQIDRNSTGTYRIVTTEPDGIEKRLLFYSYDTIIGYKYKNRLTAVFTDNNYSVTTNRHKSFARQFFGHNTIEIASNLFDIVKSPYKKEYMIKELTLKTNLMLSDLHNRILETRKSKKLECLKQEHKFYNELLNSNFSILF